MGSYSMPGNKKPGGSGNQTGANLPPSLAGWTASIEDVNWAQLRQNLDAEQEESPEKKRIREKKGRWNKNAPKDAQENNEFIEKGGGMRPSF